MRELCARLAVHTLCWAHLGGRVVLLFSSEQPLPWKLSELHPPSPRVLLPLPQGSGNTPPAFHWGGEKHAPVCSLSHFLFPFPAEDPPPTNTHTTL